MKSFNHPIKGGFGRCLNLDKEYNRYLEKTLKKIKDDDILCRWDTYTLIMEELVNLNKLDLFDEVRYRITDNEDPNQVMFDILNKSETLSGLLWLIKKRIKEFINEDFENRFY
tara:strand:+ start:3854 stop:4192 length:339 start_codon:yes stop_codon:yes gene_type:complete